MGSSLEQLTVSSEYGIRPVTAREINFPDIDFEYIDPGDTDRFNHAEYRPLKLLVTNRNAVFPTDVYESNANKIGTISPESAESLVVFYSRIRQIKNSLSELEGTLSKTVAEEDEVIPLWKLNSLAKDALRLRARILESLNVDHDSIADDQLTWTNYDLAIRKRDQQYARCERCGAEFDLFTGYTTIEMGVFHSADTLTIEGSIYRFSLCPTCHADYETWLDRGAVERFP